MRVAIAAKLPLPSIMIKRTLQHTALLFVLFLGTTLLTPTAGSAQFIDLQLEVEPELTATTEQVLDFGTLVTNSGRRMIEFGSMNMGIFSITGLENQLLMINLQKPDVLKHSNSAINDVVPLQLFSRYGYSSQDYQDSSLLPESNSIIHVEPNPDPGPWNTIYLFMYGSIDIGDIPDGVYSNDIVLNVEYI